jgi:hypothetical protein
MSPWRFVLGMVCAVLLLAAAASWSRSRVAMDVATYRFGTLRAPGEDHADPIHWTYTARSIELNHVLGVVRLRASKFKAIGSSPEEMQGWLDQPHWDGVSVPRKLLTDAPSNWTFRVSNWNDWNIMGLGIAPASTQGPDVWAAAIPHWMLCTLFASATWRLLGVPWWRWKRGRCPKCAYDLRAITAPRCPECAWDRGDTIKLPPEQGLSRAA